MPKKHPKKPRISSPISRKNYDMKLKYQKLIRKAIVIGVLILFIIIISLLKLNENISEYFFARGISRAFVFVVGNISDVFGFSIFSLFVITAIIALIACVVVFSIYLKKKLRTQAVALLERVIICALSIALIYVGTAGGCYNRKAMPLPKYTGEQLSAEETARLISAYLDDFNNVTSKIEYDDNGKSICPYSFDEICSLIKAEYKRLNNDYFSEYTPTPKKSFFSSFMSYQGISGITFQPLGEACINAETPDCYRTLTITHEIAHTKGVMRERDANLLSYYLLLTSEIPYFRYCGYMYSLRYITNILFSLDKNLYASTIMHYPEKAKHDYLLEYQFWESKQSILDDISSFFNDIYLKLSGVADGTANYSDPSTITQSTEIIDNKPITVIKVVYSDTANVLIEILTTEKCPASVYLNK